MALFRAIESARPVSTRLFDDPFASEYLSTGLRLAAFVAQVPLLGGIIPWIIERGWPGPFGSAIVRTRYIDDALGAQLNRGRLRQILILGSGFDSRAYRTPGAHACRVFEVDQPATIAHKREVIGRCYSPDPVHVNFVAFDFLTQPLDQVLVRAGFDSQLPTFAIWEGVTNYLNEPAVDSTLGCLARLCTPTSQLAFTYVNRGILDRTEEFPEAKRWMDAVARAGEPFTFGFDPPEVGGYLKARGWTLIEDYALTDLVGRYAAGRHIRASAIYHVCVASRSA